MTPSQRPRAARRLAPALCLLLAAGTAAGQDFTVTNNSDDGDPGSLRYAITQANAYGGADTITFDNDPGTIALQSTLPVLGSST